MDIISELNNFINQTKEAREIKRALAVKMILEGKSYHEIKELLQVSHSFISLWKNQDPQTPIYLFLTGGTGTGKTHTLLLLVQALQQIYLHSNEFDIEKPQILLMAYIGKVAYNIGGTMIHSALHLPIVTKTHTSLSSEKLNS